MIRKLKKGFTLVELVVVIAVIAILAAVSVVSYVGITKKAKESNDKMVIDQFNTVLRSSLTLNGRSSVHEILEYIDDNEGFDIRDFKPELKDTQFVYYDLKDSESFAYWDSAKEEVKYPDALKGMKKNSDLWFFEDATGSANKVTYSDGASHYLKSLSGATTIETNGGLDVGNQLVETINYDRSSATDNQKVTIRTNGGTLNVNAPLDTLDHYGDGEVLDIKAIASSSYHEFGHFPKAEIEQGRIVVEDKGQVEILNVTGSGVVVDEVGTGSIDLCYASSSEYVPTGTASVDVTVAEIEIGDIVARTENGAYTSLGSALSNLGTSKTLYIVADFSETFTAGSGTSMYTTSHDFTMDGQGHTIDATFVVNNKDTKIFMDISTGIVNIKNLNIVGVGIKYIFVADDDVELTFENVNIVADNCGVSASNGHLVARNCSFRFVKGEHTRNDYQEAWAPVSSQYGGTVELFNCVLHSSDGYGLLVWPSGGTLEATKCSITNAKGFAVAWARNGAGSATRADSIVRVSNCVIEGSSACEAKYSSAQGGTEGYVYKDGVLVASTLSE